MTEYFPKNFMFIIFGATGDLTKRKLIPALYKLYSNSNLHDNNPILCFSHRKLTTDEFIEFLNIPEFLPGTDGDPEAFVNFLRLIHYQSLDFTDKEKYPGFNEFIKEIDGKYNCQNNRIFYLATSPNLFETVVQILLTGNVLEGTGWKRVVFEKPFGHDLASAHELNNYIGAVFNEKDIFRIDHYLGKELMQNIIVFRFANSIFEQIWNNKSIDHVQITVAEKLGVESRGGYYDSAGAARDMLQNHILQILSLVAMEPPKSITADAIRDQNVKLLKALRAPKEDEVVIGQYGGGEIDGVEVSAYRNESKVAPDSETETFIATKINIENDRWDGVPFYVRTGKRLKSRYSEVNLVLKDVSCQLFRTKELYLGPNIITIRIQPDEGIAITFNFKVPGDEIKLRPVAMEFCQKCLFEINSPEAYEILLHQVIIGDQTLFPRWDGIEESWKFMEPVLEIIKNKPKAFPNYPSGSYGPEEADELLKKDNREWLIPKEKVHINV